MDNEFDNVNEEDVEEYENTENQEVEEEYDEELERRDRVEKFLKAKKGYLYGPFIPKLRNDLLNPNTTDDQLTDVEYYYFKSPLKMFIISFLFGILGVDRFLMGDIGMGVFKFFTCGGFLILWFIDLFKLPKRIKEENVTGLYIDILDKN